MRLYSLICSCGLFAISLLPLSAQQRVNAIVPKDKAAWIAAIPKITFEEGFWLSRSFSRLDPEMSYAILSENWKLFKDESVRAAFMRFLLESLSRSPSTDEFGNLIQESPYTYKFTPHLLDLLELCLTSPHFEFNDTAERLLRNLTLQDHNTIDSFRQWRKKLETQTLENYIREGLQKRIATLKAGTIPEKKEVLNSFMHISFLDGWHTSRKENVATHGVTAYGLTSVRRSVMDTAGITDILKDMLKPESSPELYEPALRFLARYFIEDSEIDRFEPTLKRILTAFTDKPVAKIDSKNPATQDDVTKEDELVRLIGRFKSDWATDILLKKLKLVSKPEQSWPIFSVMMETNNPKAIPVLIGMVESESENAKLDDDYNRADNILGEMTEVRNWKTDTNSNKRDSNWWRIWWHDNKEIYPVEVQKTPIAYRRSKKPYASSLLYQRAMELRSISSDLDRSYWLITPGQTRPPAFEAEQAKKALKKAEPAKAALLVILAEKGNVEAMKDVCLSAANDAFGKEYLIALVEPPVSGEKAPGGWLTKQNIATLSPGTRYSTEDFVAQIVQQLQLNTAIDPNRVFLLGEGNAGVAACSCALQKSTPFAGFCLLSSQFHTAALPPLALAKGRRFFILTGSRDRSGVSVLSGAAEGLLKGRGAIVKAEKYEGSMNSLLEEGAFAPIKSALQWLESKQ